jgi:hypothetical protein
LGVGKQTTKKTREKILSFTILLLKKHDTQEEGKPF